MSAALNATQDALLVQLEKNKQLVKEKHELRSRLLKAEGALRERSEPLLPDGETAETWMLDAVVGVAEPGPRNTAAGEDGTGARASGEDGTSAAGRRRA